MYNTLQPVLQQELAAIEEAGLFKKERIITSPQGADITVQGGKEVINFCANNYLGLSGDKRVIEAAKNAMDTHGYGLSSVRFICGTQDIHKELEKKIADFLGTEDTILYAAAFASFCAIIFFVPNTKLRSLHSVFPNAIRAVAHVFNSFYFFFRE